MSEVHLLASASAAGTLRETGRDAVGWWAPAPFREGTPAEVVAWWYEHVCCWEEDVQEIVAAAERALAQALAAERVVVWAGPHLDERAFAVWAVRTLRRAGLDPARLLLSEVSGRIGEHTIVTLGALTAEELAERCAPRPLDAAALAWLDEAWDALAAPTPMPLLELVARPSPLPWLRDGLVPFTRRYPDAVTGLNFWEHDLLANVERVGPRSAKVVGCTFDAGRGTPDELATPGGDLLIFGRLLDFAEGPAPLVRLEGDPGDGMRAVNAHLTDAGRHVLQARANALDLFDYDTWLFGVHLDPRGGSVWVRDGERLVERVSPRPA